MTWYDIRFQGQTYIENLTGASEKTLTVLGIHGYATRAEAVKHPQTMNALQAAAGGAQILAGTSGTVTNVPTPGGAVVGAGATGAAAADSLSGINAIGDFFQRLTQSATWVRVAEVVVGGLVLYVGLKGLTSGTPVGNAVKSAKSGAGKAIKTGALVIPK